jgi:short-subunit dehydrogenase
MTLGGTVLITGPTGGLGTVLALELAKRGASERPDLLLVGRAGERLTGITDAVRAAGATAEAVPCDLTSLADCQRSLLRRNLMRRAARIPLLAELVARRSATREGR